MATTAAALAIAGTYAGVTATASSATEPDGVETVLVTGSDSSPVQTGTIYDYTPVATCPEGYVVTGGGVNPGVAFNPQLINSGPSSDHLSWVGHVRTANGTQTWTVAAICALGTTS